MKPTKDMFNIENLVKLSVLAIFCYNIMGGIFDIKQDIALIKQSAVYEVKSLQYQITELKDCCNDKRSSKQLAFKQSEAILPNKIEIKE